MSRTHIPSQRTQEDPAKTTGAPPSGAPDETSNQDGPTGNVHRWMMLFCLVAMGGAMLFVLWRGNLGGGTWLLVAPMLLCIGMHFLMHRHGHRHGDD
ncbi:hypothetical protein KZO25_03195 [Halomonas sp. ANAO-440]|uniref:hypothetical protein n=1 Tax=Halomonas sp. ANAO-440 TaxID=2861360 RepID=UPI001CAA4BD7|nr:hypothetical protein [Halomonas sp. ANAO-440]MBZ0329318.1 hypothetical protein [Halomonas sp. ANAO-440]